MGQDVEFSRLERDTIFLKAVAERLEPELQAIADSEQYKALGIDIKPILEQLTNDEFVSSFATLEPKQIVAAINNLLEKFSDSEVKRFIIESIGGILDNVLQNDAVLGGYLAMITQDSRYKQAMVQVQDALIEAYEKADGNTNIDNAGILSFRSVTEQDKVTNLVDTIGSDKIWCLPASEGWKAEIDAAQSGNLNFLMARAYSMAFPKIPQDKFLYPKSLPRIPTCVLRAYKYRLSDNCDYYDEKLTGQLANSIYNNIVKAVQAKSGDDKQQALNEALSITMITSSFGGAFSEMLINNIKDILNNRGKSELGLSDEAIQEALKYFVTINFAAHYFPDAKQHVSQAATHTSIAIASENDNYTRKTNPVDFYTVDGKPINELHTAYQVGDRIVFRTHNESHAFKKTDGQTKNDKYGYMHTVMPGGEAEIMQDIMSAIMDARRSKQNPYAAVLQAAGVEAGTGFIFPVKQLSKVATAIQPALAAA